MRGWLGILLFALVVRVMALATSGRGTTYDSNVLQSLLGNVAFPAVGGAYMALYSVVATADNGTFTELTAANSPGYARATISTTNAAAAWSATTTDATGVWKTNANAITFAAATAGWTAAAGWAICLSATLAAADIIYWGTFGSATTVGSGATPSFAAGAVKITEA